MIIEIKSNNNQNISSKVLNDILTNSIDDLNDYIERMIVCDAEDLENEIKLLDGSITNTKMIGCTVNGKTILHYDKSIIFITTNILTNLYDNIVIQENANVIYKEGSLISLKTIYHEIGHAKRNQTYGDIVKKKITNNYEETLGELWKILQDEYFAEMYCAKIIKLINYIDWYGNFNDDIESENYEYYLQIYKDNGLNLNGNIALQLMHQYYFVPLFQKAGFLDGASKSLLFENVNICKTIQDIQNCNVTENDYVPLKFNDIILRKWSEFNIQDKLNG